MKFGEEPTVDSMADAVERRLGRTTGTSKGNRPPPDPKLSFKGSNPAKGKIAMMITIPLTREK